MTPRANAAALITLLVALALTGCQQDPEPKFDPDPTVSGLATGPVAPSTTAAPALGPVQTVRAWVRARNRTMRTGDPAGVNALSSADCESCESWVQPIIDVHEAGGRFQTIGWRVLRAKKDLEWARSHLVLVQIEHAAGRTWPSKDAKPIVYAATTELAKFRMVKEGDGWLVDDIIHFA